MKSIQAVAAAAKSFRALHVPGKPLLLANVYDTTSARIISSLPGCKALATASYAVALANGVKDEELSLDTQLAAVRDIAAVAHQTGKFLTVDYQDGYGDRLEEGITKLIELGVVGINLEDSYQQTGAMMEEAAAVDRVRRAAAAATTAGVQDFVINARSDTYLRGGTLDEAIRRGKLYLEAGATTIYIIGGGGPSGKVSEDVKKMAAGLDGMVNIGMRIPKAGAEAEALTSEQLAELGISRISVGPQIYQAMAEATKAAAQKVFGTAG